MSPDRSGLRAAVASEPRCASGASALSTRTLLPGAICVVSAAISSPAPALSSSAARERTGARRVRAT